MMTRLIAVMIQLLTVALPVVLVSACEGPILPSPVPPLPPAASYTLSGVITEVIAGSDDKPGQLAPLQGVTVEVGRCWSRYSLEPFVYAATNADGAYEVSGLCGGETTVTVWKDGYERAPTPDGGPCMGHEIEYPACRWVHIAGNARHDIRMVKLPVPAAGTAPAGRTGFQLR